MKRIFTLSLALLLFFGAMPPQTIATAADDPAQPVIHYDFRTVDGTTVADASGNGINGTLVNGASIVDAPGGNKALALAAGSNQYLQLPRGIMAGFDDYTISVYMTQTQVQNAAWLVSLANSSSGGYIFLSPSSAGGQNRFAITAGTYNNESGINAPALGANQWYHVAARQSGGALTLFVDGQAVGTATTALRAADILPDSAMNYIGRSAYGADPYFKGQIRDFRLYDKALSDAAVAALNESLVVVDPLAITAVSAPGARTKQIEYDHDRRTVTLPVLPGTDLADLAVAIEVNADYATVTPNPATVTDYTEPVQFTVIAKESGETAVYTVTAAVYGNPVLTEPHADPQILTYGDKYYIYSTTDGAPGWGGYYFNVFSSDDLVTWTDEGTILDLAAETPYLNSQGVAVGTVPWATGNAWAPAVIEKDGVFYFYFSGHDPAANSKSIGVATASSPTGPFTAMPTPLFHQSDAYAGQAIDPCVFQDPVSGDYFIYFGQSTYVTAYRLNDDMLSVDPATKTRINLGGTFREGIYVIYNEAGNANGNYYFMWSEDDTGSENYRVRYGVTNNPLGSAPATTTSGVSGNTLILQKDTEKNILATGHHSVLNVPGTDRWYVCYHRFVRTGGNGYTREVCLDEMRFAADGAIQPIRPTLGGVLNPMPVGGTGNELTEALDALTLFGTEDVRHNITLPATGDYGTTITWQSDQPAVISDEPQGGKAPGVVTRPVGGTVVPVILTATVTAPNGEQATKAFTALVTPTDPNLDKDYTAGYLWTYFNGTALPPSGSTGTMNNRYKIFYGFSQDGLHWRTLNRTGGTQYPVAESVVGFTGVRDPHIIRSYEGDRYWILGTDLQNGYDQENGSKSIVVWESDDLIHWTESRLEQVFSYAGNVWAPEAVYDEATGDYLVYWASRDQRDGATANPNSALRMYVSRTRDFHTFTAPVLWANEHDNTTAEKNIIDSSLAFVNGGYYRFSTSDWHTIVDYSATLSTDINDWQKIIRRGQYADFGLDSMEGLTSYRLPDGRWCVMGDNSGYRGFVIEESDFHTQQWTKLKTTGTDSMSNTFDATFRHGTVTRLSKTEEAALMAAYGKEYGYDPAPRYAIYVKDGVSNPFVATEGTAVTAAYTGEGRFLYWTATGVTLTRAQQTAPTVSFTLGASDVRLIPVTAEDLSVDDRVTILADKIPATEEFFDPSFTVTAKETVTVQLIAAAYDADGRLTGTVAKSVALTPGQPTTLSVTLDQTADRYRFFLWDGNGVPLTTKTTAAELGAF